MLNVFSIKLSYNLLMGGLISIMIPTVTVNSICFCIFE